MEKTKKEFKSNYLKFIIERILNNYIKKDYFFEITSYQYIEHIEKFCFNIGSISCQFSRLKYANQYIYTFINNSIELNVYIYSNAQVKEKELFKIFSKI